MKTLITHLKELGAVSATKVMGPKGAFVSYLKADGTKGTVPVGGKSQNGTLEAYKMYLTPDGTAIATVNEYRVAQSISLTANNFVESAKETTV